MYLQAILFGVSVAAAQAAQAANACDINHLNQASLENVAIMRIPITQPGALGTQGQIPANPQLEEIQQSASALTDVGVPSGGKVLGYTRLRLRYTPCETSQRRHYGDESRSAFERFFVGKVDNHVLKFDAQIDPIGVKASSQLYSMLRNSAKDGQSWTTDVRNDDFLLPYFRVDTSSVLTFTANFQSEGSSKFDIAGSILDIIEQGSKLITPTAVLITDENRTRFNDAADFVDGSLSKLFYKKVTETARQGIAVSPGENADQPLVRVVLIAPDPRKTYISIGWPERVIGQWDIYAERLRKSLFVKIDTNGLADLAELDPATVLNFKIDDKEVLRDRFASSEAIGKAAKSIAQKSTADVGEAAIGFCRLVAAEAARVGLAPYDMAIAAWAYLEDQGLEQSKATAAQAACHPVTRSLRLPS